MKKRLRLKKVTLRALDGDMTERVAGGGSGLPYCATPATSGTCPYTICGKSVIYVTCDSTCPSTCASTCAGCGGGGTGTCGCPS